MGGAAGDPECRLTSTRVPVLFQVIKKFRDEELEHHDTGLDHDAELVGADCGWRYLVEGPKVSVPRKRRLKIKVKGQGDSSLTESTPAQPWSR